MVEGGKLRLRNAYVLYTLLEEVPSFVRQDLLEMRHLICQWRELYFLGNAVFIGWERVYNSIGRPYTVWTLYDCPTSPATISQARTASRLFQKVAIKAIKHPGAPKLKRPRWRRLSKAAMIKDKLRFKKLSNCLTGMTVPFPSSETQS